jgi:hypothetical protein
MTQVVIQATNIAVQASATARMEEIAVRLLEIDALLMDMDPADPARPALEAEGETLLTEFAGLDGSWIEDQTVEMDPLPMSEADAIVLDQAAAAALAQRKLEYQAKRAQLAQWSAFPPLNIPDLRAGFAVLAGIVRERIFDPDLEA